MSDIKQQLSEVVVKQADLPIISAAIKRIEELEAQNRMSIGVGDGSGKLFVHGDYDSIKALQSKLFELEELEAAAWRNLC